MNYELFRKLQAKIGDYLDSYTYEKLDLGILEQLNFFMAIAEFMRDEKYITQDNFDFLENKILDVKFAMIGDEIEK